MLRFLVLASFVACAFGSVIPDAPVFRLVPMLDGRIVGGVDTTIEQHPYIVSMRFGGSHRCGGAIIDETTIFTAAHCVVGIGGTSLVFNAGSTYRLQDGQLRASAVIIVHPRYSGSTLDYDFAVVKLAQPLELGSTVIPVGLPEQDQDLPAGLEVAVSGWGALSEGGSSPNVLQTVTVPIVSNEQCNIPYNGQVTPRMFCAGIPAGGKDACQGDSGGPVVADGELVGVVSWGFGCARPGVPGVYSRIASVRDWFDSL